MNPVEAAVTYMQRMNFRKSSVRLDLSSGFQNKTVKRMFNLTDSQYEYACRVFIGAK